MFWKVSLHSQTQCKDVAAEKSLKSDNVQVIFKSYNVLISDGVNLLHNTYVELYLSVLVS
jgi:hypothetical protein